MGVCDVIIIGAGPAGTSAAAVLAERGRRVIILEKDSFPRYRVGESLIPYCWFPLNRIGMIDKLKASAFTKKYSVQFVGKSGRVSQPFYFFQHTEHDCSTTWQVVRSEFDRMLLDNAVEKDAEVMMPAAAKRLLYEDDRVVGVQGVLEDGKPFELRAPMTIDASGRDLFAVKAHDWRVDDPQLRKVAVWTYYQGARRDTGLDEGATTVAYIPGNGWFWYIPLPEDKVSVGVVAERDYLYREGKGDPDAIFDREVANQPWVREHLTGGTKLGPCRVTGDYSYRSKYSATDGLVLTGDALAFLDPVFSSGVFLALQSGVLAGEAVEAALAAGDVSAERFNDYSEHLCSGIEAMRKLVYAFYDEAFRFSDLFKKYPDLRPDLTDCLIGNLEKDFDPLFSAIAEFAQVPSALPHGRPRVTSRTPAGGG
ncbi:NAD(P)/FAD-dependent oxidoreductase [Planctomycetales bacterium ZRK34]|nr:NAD(P)/FAD-dependent oxidoreductase [Planctomycetales bacterium ZRK34]